MTVGHVLGAQVGPSRTSNRKCTICRTVAFLIISSFSSYFRKAEGYDPNGILTKVELSEKGTTGPWKIRQTSSLAVFPFIRICSIATL